MAIDINKKDHGKVVDMITSAYQASLNTQRPLFERYNEYYQIYRSIRDDGKAQYAGRAKLFVPYVFSTIETIVPRLVGNRPNIEAVPREPTDIERAKAHSEIFKYEWDVMDMKAIIKSWVKQSLIYGTGILKLTWVYNEDKGDDAPQAEVVDLFDFFYDPNATNMKNASYVIHRTERSLEELKANPNYDIPKDLEVQVTKDEYKVQRDAILGLTRPNDVNSKKVEIFEYWGLYDFGNGDEEALICLANRSKVIRAERTPYEHGEKPFIRLLDVEDVHSFEGVGEVEQLKSLQYELNDVRNQRMDNVTLILSRMWKIDKNADVDEDDLISQAGQIVHTGDMNGVEPIVTPDVTASSYNEETLIKQDMQHVSGVSDYTKGMGGQNTEGGTGGLNRTATGVMMLQEAANARFKYKIDNIEDSLKSFGQQLLGLNQQFIDRELMVRITGTQGDDWFKIDPEQIKGKFDVTVEAGSTQSMNKSVRRAEARELLQTVAPLIEVVPNLNIQYFLDHLLKTYDLQDASQAFGMGQPGGQGLPQGQGGANGGSQGKSIGATSIDGLGGPEFTSLSADTLANPGNG